MSVDTITLWRPVGQRELDQIIATGMREFPPRLLGQPIFYPVLTEAYATKIARDWDQRSTGYVTRFQVCADFLARYQIKEVGGKDHKEYWIPAQDLAAFNAAIVDNIEVVAKYPGSI